MEEYMSAMSHPVLLDLRGHFYLEPELSVPDSSHPLDYPMEVFPITDEQAILVRAQSTSLIDLPSQEVRWTITCPALEAALDMERNILALGARGWVYLWDLRSGSLLQTLPLPLGDDIPTALAFHPQGLFLAVAPYADDIQLWQLSDGQLVHRLCSEDYAAYKSIVFSPDGQFLATGNFEAGEVWLWKVSNGQPVQEMKPSDGRVQGLTFSPDGQLLVCGNAGGRGDGTEKMRVWNMQTKEAAEAFLRKDYHPAFSPDGKLLAAGDLSFIGIWDVVTRKSIRFMSAHRGRLFRITFSPSGRVLVSIGDRKPTVRWWNVENGREIYRMS
jgi:WD40 repeat protein